MHVDITNFLDKKLRAFNITECS